MPHGEDVHARVLEIEYAAMQAPYVCGAAIWCWADHAWPNRAKNSFMGDLMVSPYGLLTRDREKLRPYWAARALFKGHEQSEGDR